jgi:hypothetical protein
MKGIALNKKHLRQAAARRLTTASCIGGLLTLLSGAWIVPWVIAVASWLIHQIPWWHQAGAFPNLLHFLASPDLKFGLIWGGYYLITYAWAASTLSPRQKGHLVANAAQEYDDHYGEWSLNSYGGSYYQPPQKKEKEKEAPLSQAWPGELKHQLVEHCYQEYRNALKRFNPVPINLKTPETFFYRKGGKIEWKGSTLILPEEMLTPQRIHGLLPFLAHQLYDDNAEQISQEDTEIFPDYVPLAVVLFFTGNFLWLPVAYKHGIEGDVVSKPTTQERQLVLDRDEFAVLLGQGPALEHQLRRMEEALKEQNTIDDSIPTLIERIGRLSVLNEQERKDMRALGLTPDEPPLVIDPQLLQIRKGKKKP